MSCRVGLAFLAPAVLWLIGCVSTHTAQQLDQVYATTSMRLERPEPNVHQDVDLSGPTDRDTIIALVVSRAPSLAGVSHRARALIHAARADGSLPAGEVGLQAWNLPITRPYAVGDADMYMVELRQRFPAYGVLDARARAAMEQAQSLLSESATEERWLAQRAADAFAQYVHGHQDHALHQRHLQLLDHMQHAVQAQLTTGGSGIADAARVDLEIAKTHRAIARIQGDIARARSVLNALLRRPTSAPLGMPRQTEAEVVRLTIDELLARARAHRGATLAASARVRSAVARREAALAEASHPEFTVGLGYWQDPMRRPGFGTNVSMSLPWLWGPAQHRVDQAVAEEAAEVSSADSADLELQTEVAEAHARIAASEAELLSIHQQALPAAQRSIDALITAYSTGNASLLEWIDASRSLLDLNMEETDLAEDLAHSIAALERAVGTSLPRVAALSVAP